MPSVMTMIDAANAMVALWSLDERRAMLRLMTEALAVQRAHDWIQCYTSKTTPDGVVSFCMVGACYEAALAHPYPMLHDLRLIIGAQIYPQRMCDNDSGLAVWNDTPGRTKAEVLAAEHLAWQYLAKAVAASELLDG